MSGHHSSRDPSSSPTGAVPANDRCVFVKANGEQCGARRQKGSTLCMWHDPDRHDDIMAAAHKGGEVTRQRRANVVMPRSAPVVLESADDVRRLLADTLTRVRRGQLEVAVANCIGYLCQGATRVLEVTELERRLLALEEQLDGGKS